MEQARAEFEPLLAILERLPVGIKVFGWGRDEDGCWWVKFALDTEHSLAWRTVQELGHVLNYLSSTERLPTVFMPVSPPPYLNGGVEYLSWVIESRVPTFTPEQCAQWLSGRLPSPVDDVSAWVVDDPSDQS